MDDDRFIRGWIFRAVCSNAGGKGEGEQQENSEQHKERLSAFYISKHNRHIYRAHTKALPVISFLTYYIEGSAAKRSACAANIF